MPAHETLSSRTVRLSTPAELMAAVPVTPVVATHVAAARAAITATIAGADNRLLVVVGPCSIHDLPSAIEYGRWLQEVSGRFDDRLLLVMRAYVEKARTCLGWKGLVNDPDLNGSGRIDEGLQLSRELFVKLNELGVPLATEFIDPIVPAYLGDLVSWAAIGARTVESPTHRAMASALPCPVGFKNGTDGDTVTAINAMVAAQSRHRFLSIGADGRSAIASSDGNAASHLILRGGRGSNHDAASVERVVADLGTRGLRPRVMVDCGHGNSGGDYRNQLPVGLALAEQIARDRAPILGVMVESHLHAGAQPIVPGRPLRYGVSVTDGCLGLDDTFALLTGLYDAIE